jgi:protein-tyrosine phosphatase
MSYYSNTDINEIIPGLYISNWQTSNNTEILQKKNIKAVITLENTPKPEYILYYYKMRGIDNIQIQIPDFPNADISKYFDVTYNFIKKHLSKGDNVLVHCAAGVSRSSIIVLNYIIRNIYESGYTKKDPYNIVNDVISFSQTKRSIINPNQGFRQQLLDKAFEYNRMMR